MSEPVGVLVMAYGTPAHPEDTEAYYTHIRRGRPPTPELLTELQGRYEAIGGISPLAARTTAQVAAISTALEADATETFAVALGQKHAAPFIEDGMAELLAAGANRIVGLVLAPHFSAASVGQYHDRAARAAATAGVKYQGVDSWHLLPELTDHLAGSLRDQLSTAPRRRKVLFTAHSLPERVLIDDPYPDELVASAAAVGDAAGLSPWGDWGIAWQSAGRTPEPWRGPDLLEVLRELASTGRCDGVVVCPHGFTSDHLEVLYDIDIEARRVAGELGLTLTRTASVNDDPEVMSGLARVIAEHAGRLATA